MNAEMLLEGVLVSIPIVLLFLGARKIQGEAMFKMFYSQTNRIQCWQATNWGTSLIFVVSLYSSVAFLTSDNPLVMVFYSPKFAFALSFVTLTLLISIFASVARHESSRASEESKKKDGAQKTEPSRDHELFLLLGAGAMAILLLTIGSNFISPIGASQFIMTSAGPKELVTGSGIVENGTMAEETKMDFSISQWTLPSVSLVDLFNYAIDSPHALVFLVLGAYIHSLYASRHDKKKADLALKERYKQRTEALRRATYPAYANSWYKLCDSSDLRRGMVKEVRALDLVLAVYREDSPEGKVHVLDGYCPHLGANMAQGKVKGAALQCPFHLWEVNGDGDVCHIPYCEKIPTGARTFSYPVKEYLGMIIFYYHADKEEPTWEPNDLPEISSGHFVFRGKYDPPAPIAMHLQEFAENACDYAHFEILHGKMTFPRTQIPIPGLSIHHWTEWSSDKEQKHISGFVNKAYLSFLGRRIPKSDGLSYARFQGACGIVHFRFCFEGLGDILLVQTHLPLEPLAQKVEFRWWSDPKVPRLLVWYVVGIWLSQVENDIAVWENKLYLQKPALSVKDGPVAQLRRWYSQFYSESSRRRGDALQW